MTHPKVDWTKAPEWAVAWIMVEMYGDRCPVWLGWARERGSEYQTFRERREQAPAFGYRGTVENSLTLRPKD